VAVAVRERMQVGRPARRWIVTDPRCKYVRSEPAVQSIAQVARRVRGAHVVPTRFAEPAIRNGDARKRRRGLRSRRGCRHEKDDEHLRRP
jgi:hypothetical protein